MSKRAPRYMLPAHSSATRNSITHEEIRQRRGNTSKGKTHDRSPTHACSSRKFTYEKIMQINAAERNMSGRPTLPPRDDQKNRGPQHAKSTLKVPDENYWDFYFSDQTNREYPCPSKSLESSDDDLDIKKPPCPQMPRTDYDLSTVFSSLKLSPTREKMIEYRRRNLESLLCANDLTPSQTTQSIESADFDVKINENDEVLTLTGQNQDALKNNVESKSDHGSIFPVKKVPESGSSNGEDYSYRNTTGISATLLYDDNIWSPSQTNTDLERSLAPDTKQKKQQKAPTQLRSKEKPRKPEYAIINTSNDSKLQDDDDSAIPLLTHKKAVAVDYKKLCDNLLFYQGKIKSKPAPGYTIETILERFCDDDFIEKNYPYCIKWLFPIPKSLDRNTQELLPHEVKAIQNDKETASRVFKAFVLVLDYYGIIMVNTETGELMKSRNWKNRWTIINTNNEQEFKHITRVLVSLGALGYERYQVPLIEIFIKNKDDITEFDWNSVRHWIDNVNDEEQQNALFEKYGEQIFSLETLEAYDTQTKHEQQQSGFDNTLEHLGTIGS